MARAGDDKADDAQFHAAAHARQRAAEAEQARPLLEEFVREARERGIAPERLSARGYGGSRRYRTGVTGWYLKRDRTIAVGTDGEYYILSVPDSLGAIFTGTPLAPALPVMEVGRGGRDGESMPLEEALRRRLERGNSKG